MAFALRFLFASYPHLTLIYYPKALCNLLFLKERQDPLEERKQVGFILISYS